MKVISGGQTGVDSAALRAARAYGLETGGTAPKGWRTEAGPAPWLADYGLVEHASEDYAPRTRKNVEDADGTILIGNPYSAGSRTTLRSIVVHDKPCVIFSRQHAGKEVQIDHKKTFMVFQVHEPDPHLAWMWLRSNGIQVVNVAGNRERDKPPLIGPAAEAFLVKVFKLWKGE